MSDSNSGTSSYVTTLSGALTVLFIALKLCGKISWSWWWVLSPLLLDLGVLVIVLLVTGVLFLLASRD